MLCVFSYVAAAIEKKKKTPLQLQQTPKSTKPQQQPQQQPKVQSPQQHLQKTQPQPPQQQRPTQHLPSQQQQQTIQKVITIQPKKPTVTTANVQPPSQQPQQQKPQPSRTTSVSSPATRPHQSTSQTTTTTITTTAAPIEQPPKARLPQLPPRVQSQNSITSRGPPPAIPPRANVVPPPIRAGSVQVNTTSTDSIEKRVLVRQQSQNSIPPQYTPQAPPKFVIPQRQNSRTSLGRNNSISGPSGSAATGGTSPVSPQMPRRH